MQSHGIGGAIVEVLAAAAHARGRSLVLRVLKVNNRKRQFYERAGLQVTGESPHHWTMALPNPQPVLMVASACFPHQNRERGAGISVRR